MKMLFPVVRYSDVSSILAPFVKNMVRVFKAELHVLRVEPMMNQFSGMQAKEAEEWLTDFIARHFGNCDVHQAPIVPGDPAHEILRYINEFSIDCVIIGTHGRKMFGTVQFGSVAREIVGKATVPVLSINPHLMSPPFMKRNAAYLKDLVKGNL